MAFDWIFGIKLRHTERCGRGTLHPRSKKEQEKDAAEKKEHDETSEESLGVLTAVKGMAASPAVLALLSVRIGLGLIADCSFYMYMYVCMYVCVCVYQIGVHGAVYCRVYYCSLEGRVISTHCIVFVCCILYVCMHLYVWIKMYV